MAMRLTRAVGAAGLLAALALTTGCGMMDDAVPGSAGMAEAPRPAAAVPVGTTADEGNKPVSSYLSGMNPINRDYYIGGDPVYPRGSSSGSYGHPPGGGGP